jgi:hypothetical protein
MTEQTDPAPVLDGTDISADPADLDEAPDVPATSDPEQMTDGDDELGGVAGQGGAG